jgi:Zn-dependent protease
MSVFLILIFSVVLHEYAHGYAAYKYGDDTAYLMGRLTLNPIPHIDPVMTIFVPLALHFAGLPVIGGAKGVPVNYYKLRDPKRDMAKVAFAGPLTNISLVILAALIIKAMLSAGVTKYNMAVQLLQVAIEINLILAIFNLIPVPPLDGSRILAAVLPGNLGIKYLQFERYGMMLVFALFVLGVFSHVIFPVFYFLRSLVYLLIGVA